MTHSLASLFILVIKNYISEKLISLIEKVEKLTVKSLWYYRAGRKIKSPPKYPFIPYPIREYPFKHHEDIDTCLRIRLEKAELVIDNVLYVSHLEGRDDQEKIKAVKEEALRYISLPPK